MEWTHDLSIELIRQYQARPELWDASHESYRVQTRKYETWRELAALFSCDIADVRKKLNSLLASHRREKARVRHGQRSTWFLYPHLSFLPTHVDNSDNLPLKKKPKFERKLNEVEVPMCDAEETSELVEVGDMEEAGDASLGEEEPEIEALDEDMETVREHILIKEEPTYNYRRPQRYSRSRHSRPAKKKAVRDSSTSQLTYRLMEALRMLRRPDMMRQKDECDSFGEYIADSLRKHDDRTQSMIKQAINNILFEQEMKKYNINQQYTVVIANSDENPLILDGNEK